MGNGIKITSMKVWGYLGAYPDEARALGLTDCRQCNVAVGPNNSGKSILFRLLHLLKSKALSGFPASHDIDSADVGPQVFWRENNEQPIEAELKFRHQGKVKGPITPDASVVREGEYCIRFRLTSSEPGRLTVTTVPQVWWNRGRNWTDIAHVKFNNAPLSAERVKDFMGQWVTDLCDSMYFFDAVRALDRGDGRSGDDGAKLLDGLYEQQVRSSEARAWLRFEQNLRDSLNGLLVPSGVPEIARIEIKLGGSQEKVMVLYPSYATDCPIYVSHMGSGIAQLVIILSALIRRAGQETIVFVEEPETHLHPGLLRRAMQLFRSEPSNQFFVATHSNAIIDSVQRGDRVYQFRQDSRDGACTVVECRALTDQQRVLDELGVSGSTLLQANAVIWVEGPSDRLYIKAWLDEMTEAFGGGVKEGSDYSFAFYGGALLSHLSLSEDAEIDDLVSLICVNRYSAVVMDRDLRADQSDDDLLERKKRVIGEAEEDPEHRLAVVTDGREIENDLPSSLLLEGCASVLGLRIGDVAGCEIRGRSRYPEEVVEHLGLNESEAESARRKLRRKVELAREILAIAEESKRPLQPPMYVQEIVRLVLAARCEGGVA